MLKEAERLAQQYATTLGKGFQTEIMQVVSDSLSRETALLRKERRHLLKEADDKMKVYVADELKKFEKENLLVDGLIGPEEKHPNVSNFLE